MIVVRTFSAAGVPLDRAEASSPGSALYTAACLLREARETMAGSLGRPTVSFYAADGRLIAGLLRRVDVPKEEW